MTNESPLDQLVLFEAWYANDGEVPANTRAAYRKIWQVALGAQHNPDAPAPNLSPAQLALFNAWYDSGPQLPSDVEELFAVWLACIESA